MIESVFKIINKANLMPAVLPPKLFCILALSIIISLIPINSFAQQPPLEIFVSILPQAYLVEQLAGEYTQVHALVSSNQDPHTFEPTPKQIVELGKAQIYFLIGIPFEERLVEKIKNSNKNLTFINTTEGIVKRKMTEEHHHHASEEETQSQHQEHSLKGQDQHEEEFDPHVWLAPPIIKILTQNMTSALIKIDPAHAAIYETNFANFSERLQFVHEKITSLLKPYSGASFYVFHPAFGYFGDAYNLHQIAIEEEGKAPTPKQLSALIKKAKAENVKIIFVQPQFDPKSAESVAEAISGSVLPIDPMAKDILSNLEDIASKIESSLIKK